MSESHIHNRCCTENPTTEEQNNILNEALSINKSLVQNNKSIADDETINIKLVYHICFQNPGTTEEIENDIQIATDILNRDFNKNAYNFDNGKSVYEADVPAPPELIPLIPYAKYRKNKKIIRLSSRRLNQLRRQLGFRRYINYIRKINRINFNRFVYNYRSIDINRRRRRKNRNRSRKNRYRKRINNDRMSKYNSDNAESLAILNRYNDYVSRAGSCNINFTHDKTIVLSTPLQDLTQNDDLNNIIKINGSPIQSGDEYKLNVWVVNFSYGLLGYATTPWSYSTYPTTDGVVINKNTFKQSELDINYNLGKTLTHEVGHWLGMYHPFQQSYLNQQGIIDTNGDGIIETGENSGDLVIDTPEQLSATYGNPYLDSKNWPSSTINGQESYHMFMNFMDYPFDLNLFMFTEEQCKKMRIFINAYRLQFHTP